MGNQENRIYKSYFVESRLLSVLMSIFVMGARFLMFWNNGLREYVSPDCSFVWPYIEPYLSRSPFIPLTLSTGVVFIIAFLLSELNVRFGIIRSRTTMPFYLPLIIFSVHPLFMQFTPDLVAIIFIVWALFPLLSSYQQHHKSAINAFHFSVLIAVAGLFYVPSLSFLIVWWFGLAAIGNFSLRAFFSSLFGVFLVYWIMFAFYVFGDNIGGFVIPFQSSLFIRIYDFSTVSQITVPQWGGIVVIYLIFTMAILADIQQLRIDRNFTKKVLVFSNTVILLSLPLQILFFGQTFFWFYTAVAFLCIVLSHYFSNISSKIEINGFYIFIAFLTAYTLLNTFTRLSPF